MPASEGRNALHRMVNEETVDKRHRGSFNEYKAVRSKTLLTLRRIAMRPTNPNACGMLLAPCRA
jgi:hypothetical protein